MSGVCLNKKKKIGGCGNEVILYQPITMIRPYLINVHTELSNCSTVEQTTKSRSLTEWFTLEETEVLVHEIRN